MKQFGLFIAMCLVLAGCGSNGISEALGEQVRAEKSADLGTVGAGDWDRVCVLGPYSNDQAARDTLGFNWPVESRTSVGRNDSISLLLFVREQQVLHSVEHPRGHGDFSELSGRCFPREQAQFVQAERDDSWPELVPRDGT